MVFSSQSVGRNPGVDLRTKARNSSNPRAGLHTGIRTWEASSSRLNPTRSSFDIGVIQNAEEEQGLSHGGAPYICSLTVAPANGFPLASLVQRRPGGPVED